MLLELEQSSLAREGLGAACSAIVNLLEYLATNNATATGVPWKHGRGPKKDALSGVLALTARQRTELFEAVSFDLGFVDRLDDPTFAFQFPALDAETQKAGKSLLLSMYEDVFCHRIGFLFGSDRQANRGTWERAFREANPGVELCPACATSLLEPPVAGRTLVDADHYLPKATYPALAVHGFNLVPLCKPCNSALKGSKDPLSDGSGTYGLPDIWFPYKRPGITEIGLSFDLAEEAGKQVRFTGETTARKRAQRFDAVFQVLERWSGVMTAIQQRLPRELSRLQASADPEGVLSGLKTLERWAEEERTDNPRAFVKSRYYAWVQGNNAAIKTLVSQVRSIETRPGGDQAG